VAFAQATTARAAAKPATSVSLTLPANVDTLRVTGYDANGNVLLPQQDYAATTLLIIKFVPIKVTRITIAYLRNQSVQLHTSSFPVYLEDGEHREDSPQIVSAPDTTTWTLTRNASGYFTMKQSINSAPGTAFRIKGVCYSPTRVPYQVSELPFLGDYFFDTTVPIDPNGTVQDSFFAIWGSGALSGTPYNARNDILTIKAMGCNAIRVYAMMSRWPICDYDNDPNNPHCNWIYQPTINQGNNYTQYQGVSHIQFLDWCYKNGIYVLVDIPMPDFLFQLGQPEASTGQGAFWEYVLNETTSASTVGQGLGIGDHPAVIGFNIMNEQDAQPWTTGGTCTNYASTYCTDYFWGQAKKYAATIKANAPGKLVGWAAHDSPPIPYFAANYMPLDANFPMDPNDANDPNAYYCSTGANTPPVVTPAQLDPNLPYGAQVPFDYWGVNTYQDYYLTPVLGNQPNSAGANQYAYGQLQDPNDPNSPLWKPVIFTEFGWPATTNDPNGAIVYTEPNDPNSFDPNTYDPNSPSNTTGANAAHTLACMMQAAYSNLYSHFFLGAFYFEFSDEWYKNGQPNAWNGGPPDSGRPNCYDDEEGFGIYSLSPADPNGNPFSSYYAPEPNDPNLSQQHIGPALPNDTLVTRTVLWNAIYNAFTSFSLTPPTPDPNGVPETCATPPCQ